MNNVLNKTIIVRNYNDDILLAIEINNNGDIIQSKNCNIINEDVDFILKTKNDVVIIKVDGGI